MKKVTFNNEPTILFENISTTTPIFVKKDGVMKGIVALLDNGWAISTGVWTPEGTDEPYATKEECIQTGMAFGYEFYIDE